MDCEKAGEFLNIFSQCGVSDSHAKNSAENTVSSPAFTIQECNEVLQNYLNHSAFVLDNFSLNLLQQRGGNLGDYYTLILWFTEQSKPQKLVLFAKFLPSLNQSTNAMARNGPSKKEDFFYNTLTEEYKRIGFENYLDFYPKCFLSKINHVLVMEDLRLENYVVTKPPNFYTYDMLRLTVRQLAKLHAGSLVYEEIMSMQSGQQFRLDDRFGEYFKEILFHSDQEDDIKKMSHVGVKAVTEYIIYQFPDIVKNLTIEEFKCRSKEAFHNLYIKIRKNNTLRNTFCHGDVWATNILFKFDENNHPVACKIIDYQLIRYCPPTQDLLSHIYLTTRKETRIKYMDTLLQEYYSCISDIVKSFGLDINKVFSKKDFEESCDFMKSQGICQALLYGPINLVDDRQDVFTDEKKFANIMLSDRSEFIEEMMKKYPYYKECLKELIEDLYEVCETNQHKILL